MLHWCSIRTVHVQTTRTFLTDCAKQDAVWLYCRAGLSNWTFQELQSAIFPAMARLKVKFPTRKVKLRPTQKSEEDEEAKKARARQSNRARVQAYRERIKQDEVKWNHYKKEKQIEMRIYRLCASEEQKQRGRETAKVRMRKYREQLKSKRQLETTKPLAETKKTELQVQQEDWKMKQRVYRSKLTAQKQQEIREKDRKRKQDERKRTTHNDVQDDVAKLFKFHRLYKTY